MARTPERDRRNDPLEHDDESDDVPAGGLCPICELGLGECDHLLASIDLTYSEIVSGTIFAYESSILDLLAHLAASDPDMLKAAGAGPLLEHLATLVRDETQQGASTGEALAACHAQMMAVLSHLLQEEEDVSVSSIEADDGDDSAVENLWARRPEHIVDLLIERLQELVEEVDAG